MKQNAYIVRSSPSGIKRIEEITKENQVIIGWSRIGTYISEDNLSRQRIKDLLLELYPDYNYNNYGVGQAAGYLLRFLIEMKIGDYVLVPIARAFYLGRVTSEPIYLREKEEDDTAIRRDVEWLNNGAPILRNLCGAGLVSRMKYQGTCVGAGDFIEEIEQVLGFASSGHIPDFRIELSEKLKAETESYLIAKSSNLSPDKFEDLIKEVMLGLGATKAFKPSKQKYKDSKADVDIVAIFEQLGLEIYIQAKHHINETDKHAVEQVLKAIKIDNPNGDSPIQGWVITSGKFDAEAEKLANNSGIRVVTGSDLADIIVSIGMNIFKG